MIDSDALYFRSPTEAVAGMSEMLNASDWKTVARYYDLSGTEIRREDLVTGRFFTNSNSTGTPLLNRPGACGPCAAGFKYERHAPDGPDTIRVYLKMEIDQGDGMVQRSLAAFRMRKSDRGYQVLPDEVSYFD